MTLAPSQGTGRHLGHAGRRRMLPVLLTAMFMAQFDLYVVNVAAPSLRHGLHAGPAALELIVAGYGFSYAGGLITGGRLGDLFGSRPVFLAGTAGFTAASLLCGLAPSPGPLIVARLLQGLAGAAMVPQILALIRVAFPAPERTRALAWFGGTLGVGAVAGQVLGGALLEADPARLGWRVIFLVNVPIGLLVLAPARRLVPRPAPAARRPTPDPLGATGLSAGLALALLPLVLGRAHGWPGWAWACLACAVPVLAATVAWEAALARRGGQPSLDLTLFRNRVFVPGLVVGFAIFCGFFSFLFAFTLVLQDGLRLAPVPAGLTFTPLGLAFAAASIASPRLAARHGARLVTAGAAIATVGTVLLLAVLWRAGPSTGTGTVAGLAAALPVIGLGNGMAIPAVTGVVLAGARGGQAGTAAGVLTTAQQFASAAGIATLGTVFFTVVGHRHGAAAYLSGLTAVAVIDLALVLVAGAASLLLPRRS